MIGRKDWLHLITSRVWNVSCLEPPMSSVYVPIKIQSLLLREVVGDLSNMGVERKIAWLECAICALETYITQTLYGWGYLTDRLFLADGSKKRLWACEQRRK